MVYEQLSATYRVLGQLPGLGVVLVAVLMLGIVLLARRTPSSELRRRAAAPVALLAGGLVFATLTAFGRAVGP